MALTKISTGMLKQDAASSDLNIDAGTLYLDVSNNRVGIANTSPQRPLHVVISSGTTPTVSGIGMTALVQNNPSTASSAGYGIISGNAANGSLFFGDAEDADVGRIQYEHNTNAMTFRTNASEAMRINSSGNLLVGKTSSAFGTAGVEINQNGVAGKVFMTRSGGDPLSLNRLSSDGEIQGFYKDGTQVGGIGVIGGDILYIGTTDGTDAGLNFDGDNSRINPANGTGTAIDGVVDLGQSGARFKDLYLSNAAYLDKVMGHDDTNTYISFIGSDVTQFVQGGAEAMRITSAGDVQIGTAAVTGGRYFDIYNTGSTATDFAITRFITQQVGSTSTTSADIYKRKNGEFGIANNDTDSAAYINFKVGATERMRIDSSGNILFGATGTATSSYGAKVLKDGSASEIFAVHRQAADGDLITFARGGTDVGGISYASGYLDVNGQVNGVTISSGGTERMRIDSSGQVGIGGSPSGKKFEVIESSGDATMRLRVTDGASNQSFFFYGNYTGPDQNIYFGDSANTAAAGIRYSHSADAMRFTGKGNGSEMARFDSSGDLIVGGTSSGANDAVSISNTGYIQAIINGDTAGYFNRRTSDGEIVRFQKDGNTVGSIGNIEDLLYIATDDTTDCGIRFDGDNQEIVPCTATGAISDGNIDLGNSSGRFKDLHLSGDVALTESFVFGNTDGLNLRANSGKVISMQIAGSEKARIDSSGLLGIGTSLPASALHVVRNTNNYIARFENTDASTPYTVWIREPSSASSGYPLLNITDNAGTDTYFRADSGGNVYVGTSSTVNTAKSSIKATSSTNVLGLQNVNNNNYLITALNSSSTEVFRVAGTGNVSNTNNSYGSLSDERLKSNIVDASSQLDDIMAVQVRSYTLDSTGETHIGVVAQELEAAGMSGLVEEDKEGMKSVKYSVLYMKALKALQEATAKIENLEARVVQLEGAN